MGLREWLFGSPPEPERKIKKKPAPFNEAEFMAKETKRTLARLRKEKPEVIEKIILAQLAAKNHWDFDKTPKIDPSDPLATYKKVKKEITELKDDESDRGWVRDLIPGALQLLTAVAQSNAAQQQRGAVTVTDFHQSPQQLTNHQRPAALPAGQSQMGEDDMSFVANYLIGQLKGKTPEQAAKWLLRRKETAAVELIIRLREEPVERLPELLSEMERRSPALAPFVAWLRTRSSWLLETVKLIKNPPAVRTESPGF